jgi:hypothetical protein
MLNWSDVLAKPELQNLPYKIELNALGNITRHSAHENADLGIKNMAS